MPLLAQIFFEHFRPVVYRAQFFEGFWVHIRELFQNRIFDGIFIRLSEVKLDFRLERVRESIVVTHQGGVPGRDFVSKMCKGVGPGDANSGQTSSQFSDQGVDDELDFVLSRVIPEGF